MGVDPFRQPGDQLPELCRAERLHDPLPVDLPGGDAQRDVGREAAVGDEKVLRDVPDAVLPCPAVGRRKWRAVDGDFTPSSRLKSVVFPAPEAPRIPMRSPLRIVSERP